MKTLVAFLSLFPLLALAQGEHTGHGFFDFLHRHQQMQKQQAPMNKQLVVDGEKALQIVLENHLDTQHWQDLSSVCSEPVHEIYFDRHSRCFDRGESFTRGSRFKCYIEIPKRVSLTRDLMFSVFHNDCGGDGIYHLKQKRQK